MYREIYGIVNLSEFLVKKDISIEVLSYQAAKPLLLARPAKALPLKPPAVQADLYVAIL